MDIHLAIRFLTWCTIMDVGLMFLWAGACLLMPDLAYQIQNRFFPMTRETYNTVMYAFLGVFKIFVIIFNVVPLLALLIIG